MLIILTPFVIIFFFIFIIGKFFPMDLSSKVFLAVNSESLAALAPCNMAGCLVGKQNF